MVGADIDGADEREDSAGSLQQSRRTGDLTLTGREQQRDDPDRRRAERRDAPGAEPIQRDAGDKTEGRAAVVEETRQFDATPTWS